VITQITNALAKRHHVRAQFWQSLSGYTQTIGGMVMGVILARLLAPEVFGQLAYIAATLMLFMIPFNVSATQVLVADGGRTPQLFGRVLGLAIVTMTLKLFILTSLAGWYFWRGTIGEALVAILVGLPLVFMDLFNVLRADLEGRGNFKPNFEVQFVGVFTQGIVGIALVLLGWGIYGLALAGFIGFLPQLYLYWKPSGRRLTEASISRQSLASQLHVSWWLWLATACSAALLRVDKIAVGSYTGDTKLGYYNRGINYSPVAALAMWSLMTNATVVALKTQKDSVRRFRMLTKMSAVMGAGAMLNWAVLYFFSDPLVVWVFGAHWAGAIPVFQAFGWLSLAYTLYHLPATLLFALDAYRSLALVRLCGLLIFVFLVWIRTATSTLSETDVAYALCIAMAITGALTILAGFIQQVSPHRRSVLTA
jgi:lipopolysaccharide exporter